MNKPQFLILNAMALFFLLLTGMRFLLLKDLEEGKAKLVQTQAVVAQGQQSEQVLRKVILRLVQASQHEPDLKDLLKQYNIKVAGSSAPAAPASATPSSGPAAPGKTKP